MKAKYIHSLYGLFLMLNGLAACHFSSRDTGRTDTQSKPYHFAMPSIPEAITEPSERANYLVSHYWDSFDFTDTSYIHFPDITEQALVEYIYIFPQADKKVVNQSIHNFLSNAETKDSGQMYTYFLNLFDKYLYDPNSPFRNEEYYIPVTQYMLTDSRSGETEKIRTRHNLEMMMKNRQGEIAADFVYTLSSGKTGWLHAVKADYTILMFYNPDCHACGQIIDAMKGSSLINKLQEGGSIAILLFYPDEDIEIWKRHIPDIPENWINGYDRNTKVKNGELYDLRAIPTLYLLDKEKKVLLKDVDYPQLEQWLRNKFPLIIY
jgi:hypothetical protein